MTEVANRFLSLTKLNLCCVVVLINSLTHLADNRLPFHQIQNGRLLVSTASTASRRCDAHLCVMFSIGAFHWGHVTLFIRTVYTCAVSPSRISIVCFSPLLPSLSSLLSVCMWTRVSSPFPPHKSKEAQVDAPRAATIFFRRRWCTTAYYSTILHTHTSAVTDRKGETHWRVLCVFECVARWGRSLFTLFSSDSTVAPVAPVAHFPNFTAAVPSFLFHFVLLFDLIAIA